MKQTKDFVLIYPRSLSPANFVHWEIDCAGQTGWKVFQIDVVDLNVLFDSATVALPVPADWFTLDIFTGGKRLDPSLSTTAVVSTSTNSSLRAYDTRIPVITRGETSRQTDTLFSAFPCFENPVGERIQCFEVNLQNSAACAMAHIAIRLRVTYEEHGSMGSMFSLDAESFFAPASKSSSKK